MKLKSAIIPYRIKRNKESGGKELEFLLVRNSIASKWVIPKGTVSHPLKAHLSATKEAYEEAGVLGKTHPVIIGQYFRNNQLVPAYLLEVDLVLEVYDENDIRERKWVKEREIHSHILEDDLSSILRRAVRIIRKKGHYFMAAMETFAGQNGFRVIASTKKEVRIESPDSQGVKFEVRVKRSKWNLEFCSVSGRRFLKLTELKPADARKLLLENARSKIGFWCLVQGEGYFELAKVQNARLQLLDSSIFKVIIENLNAR